MKHLLLLFLTFFLKIGFTQRDSLIVQFNKVIKEKNISTSDSLSFSFFSNCLNNYLEFKKNTSPAEKLKSISFLRDALADFWIDIEYNEGNSDSTILTINPDYLTQTNFFKFIRYEIDNLLLLNSTKPDINENIISKYHYYFKPNYKFNSLYPGESSDKGGWHCPGSSYICAYSNNDSLIKFEVVKYTFISLDEHNKIEYQESAYGNQINIGMKATIKKHGIKNLYIKEVYILDGSGSFYKLPKAYPLF